MKTKAAPGPRTVSAQFRRILEGRDSAHALALEAGVDPGVVRRFLTGRRSMTLDTLDRLAPLLGLRLVEGTPAKAAARKPRPRAARPAIIGDPGDGTAEARRGDPA